VRYETAWRSIAGGRKSIWAQSQVYAAYTGMRPLYFAERGLRSLEALWKARSQHLIAPVQLLLPLG